MRDTLTGAVLGAIEQPDDDRCGECGGTEDYCHTCKLCDEHCNCGQLWWKCRYCSECDRMVMEEK